MRRRWSWLLLIPLICGIEAWGIVRLRSVSHTPKYPIDVHLLHADGSETVTNCHTVDEAMDLVFGKESRPK